MTIDEKVDLILTIVQGMHGEMQGMQTEIRSMQTEMQGMQTEIRSMQTEMQSMKTDIQTLNGKVDCMQSEMEIMRKDIFAIQVSLENETNRNIKLLAENHGNLIDKLNEAIKVSDKNSLYEIQVNILAKKVDCLEKDVEDLKNHIA